MKRQRQGVRSTKVLESIPEEEDRTTEADDSPTPHKSKKMNDFIVMVRRWTDHILARNPLLEVEADLS